MVPVTEAVNCFDQNWSRRVNWLVPPPSCALKCIEKLEKDRGCDTLIVPEWKSGPFWPFIVHSNGEFRWFIKDSFVLPNKDAIMPGIWNKGLFSKDLSFRMIALKCDFALKHLLV